MRRVVLLGLAAAVIAIAALTAVGWPASRYLQGDFIQYYLGGRALLEGRDPYDAATWRAMHDEVGSRGYEETYFYPLTTAVATLPFSSLPVSIAAPSWFVAQSALVAVALVALGRRIFRARPRRDVVLLLVLAALLQPALVVAGDGNIARHLLAVAASSVALLVGGATFAAGAVLGLVVLKPQAFVVVVPALLVRLPSRRRFAIGFAASSLALLAVSLAFRPDWIPVWIERATAFRGAGVGTDVWGAFRDARAAAVVAAASVGALAWWSVVRRPDLASYAAAAFAISAWLAPRAEPYDQSVLVVAVAAILASIEALDRLPRALLVAATATCLALPYWLSVGGLLPRSIETPLVALQSLAAFGLIVLADAVARRRLMAPARVEGR